MVHIANPIYIDPDPLIGLNRPYLVIEYVGSGHLLRFLNRVKGAEMQVPNRLLLGFFVCRKDILEKFEGVVGVISANLSQTAKSHAYVHSISIPG